jgi:hypothetical protein
LVTLAAALFEPSRQELLSACAMPAAKESEAKTQRPKVLNEEELTIVAVFIVLFMILLLKESRLRGAKQVMKVCVGHVSGPFAVCCRNVRECCFAVSLLLLC